MQAAVFGLPAGKASTPSPMVLHKSPYVFLAYFQSHGLRSVLAGLLLFVLVGSGTASAAQGSLPGDLLYPVKVSINEKVEAALAPSVAAKAEVAARQAERRVEEAQELAAQGRLDEKTADALTESFDAHAAQAVALAEPDETPAADTQAKKAPAPAPVLAPESSADAAPARTMMVQTSAAPAVEAPSATTTATEPQVQKNAGHRESLRDSLRAKGEIIKELKVRALKLELQKDGRNGR